MAKARKDNRGYALTIPQQRAFTEFLKDNREFTGWAPLMIVLLGTGMRIFC